MRLSCELLKRTRYHKESNLRARSLIYDNITKSRDYYFSWSHKTLQPQKFPFKPLKWTSRVYQRNFYSDKVSTGSKPGIFKKYKVQGLNPDLVNDEILSKDEFDAMKSTEFSEKKLMGYAPYHAYKHPHRPLAGYTNVKDQVIRDFQEKTGQDLPEKYKIKLEEILSYEYASKEKKQEVHYNDVMEEISSHLPNLRPSDLMPGSPIQRLAYQTTRIRNLMEDSQELFSIKRYDNQRDEKDGYDRKRFEIKELLIIRSKTLAEIRRLNIDHYYSLLQLLNLEVVDPPRRTLDKDFNEHHAQKRAMSRLYKYASYDPRIGDRMTSSEQIKSRSSTIDYFDHHVVSHINKHTAQIIDMRIRTFAHMETLAKERIVKQRRMDLNIERFKKKIKRDLYEGATEEEKEKWGEIGFWEELNLESDGEVQLGK